MQKLILLLSVFLLTGCTASKLATIPESDVKPPITTEEEARRFAVNEFLNRTFVEEKSENWDDTNVSWHVDVKQSDPYTVIVTTGSTIPRYSCSYTFDGRGSLLSGKNSCYYNSPK